MLLREILDILDNDTRVILSTHMGGLPFKTNSFAETISNYADDELLQRPVKEMYVPSNKNCLCISI